MRSEDLQALAERCEKADPSETYNLLVDACLACDCGGYDEKIRGRIQALAMVDAWESAAVAFFGRVLSEAQWDLANHNGREFRPYAHVWCPGPIERRGSAATPALALLAACLRALAQQPQEGGNGL